MEQKSSQVPNCRDAQSEFLLHNLARLAFAGHTVILVAVWAAGLTTLVIINLVSCILYLTALVLNRRKLYVTVVVLGLLEVIVHAWVATWLLGWESGFHIYVLALVPLVYFFDPWPLRVRVIVSVAVAACYVVLAWTARQYFTSDPRWFVEWFDYANLLFGAAILSMLSFFYGKAIGQVRDDLEVQNERLDDLAKHDSLTGLPNRRHGQFLLEKESDRIREHNGVFSVGLLDIDHFKRVNDEFGHDCGDTMLLHATELVKSALRAHDSVVRWGGEEFLLLLPDTDCDGAYTVAEKLRTALISSPTELAGTSTAVSCTIGISSCRSGGRIDLVLKDADRALYRGKEAGRNQVMRGTNCSR